MPVQPIKLTVDEIEKILSIEPDTGDYREDHIYRQLADALRDNERLRTKMLEAHRLITDGEIFEATAILKIEGEQRYKDSDNE